MSAARPCAFISIFSLEAGTARHERRGRERLRSDMAQRYRPPADWFQTARRQPQTRPSRTEVMLLDTGPALLLRQSPFVARTTKFQVPDVSAGVE